MTLCEQVLLTLESVSTNCPTMSATLWREVLQFLLSISYTVLSHSPNTIHYTPLSALGGLNALGVQGGGGGVGATQAQAQPLPSAAAGKQAPPPEAATGPPVILDKATIAGVILLLTWVVFFFWGGGSYSFSRFCF